MLSNHPIGFFPFGTGNFNLPEVVAPKVGVAQKKWGIPGIFQFPQNKDMEKKRLKY